MTDSRIAVLEALAAQAREMASAVSEALETIEPQDVDFEVQAQLATALARQVEALSLLFGACAAAQRKIGPGAQLERRLRRHKAEGTADGDGR